MAKKTLESGFEGEARAHLLYHFFARAAEQEASLAPSIEVAVLLRDIAALYRHIAEEEFSHAYTHLTAMEGIGDTQQNLQTAIERETFEYKVVYPTSAMAARTDGNEQIASKFEALSYAERRYAEQFEELRQMLADSWLKKRLETV